MNPHARNPLIGQSAALANLASSLSTDAALLWGMPDVGGICSDVAQAAAVLHAVAAHASHLEYAEVPQRPEPPAADGAPPAPARAKRPPAAGPRHKFGPVGTCVAIHGADGKVCGAAKGRPGRPPAEPAPVVASEALPGVVPPGYRAPLDMTAAADRHADGALGSSGVRR